jgi:osmotically-inducible protein OsmY
MDGGVVVLKGTVADEQDRRNVVAMALMTPGVYQVRDEMVVRETTAGR